MKPIRIVGIVLIIAGIIALAYGGFSYTKKEKVVDLGPLQVNADKTHTFPLPPILGGLMLVGGVVLLVVGNKQS